jgi:hypothetical protein
MSQHTPQMQGCPIDGFLILWGATTTTLQDVSRTMQEFRLQALIQEKHSW